jgi:hypothetical protein
MGSVGIFQVSSSKASHSNSRFRYHKLDLSMTSFSVVNFLDIQGCTKDDGCSSFAASEKFNSGSTSGECLVNGGCGHFPTGNHPNVSPEP